MGQFRFVGYKVRCVRCGYCDDKKAMVSACGFVGKVCRDRFACNLRVAEKLKEEART